MLPRLDTKVLVAARVDISDINCVGDLGGGCVDLVYAICYLGTY